MSERKRLTLAAITAGEALAVVIIGIDGTVAAQGPFLSAETAAGHAAKWTTEGSDAAVVPLERPSEPGDE